MAEKNQQSQEQSSLAGSSSHDETTPQQTVTDKLMAGPSSSKPLKKRGRSSKETSESVPKKKTKTSTASGTEGTSSSSGRKKYRTQKQVHNLLKKLGISEPESVCACLKEGIRKFFINLLPPEEDPEGEHGLDQVIVSNTCLVCGEYKIKATIRDVLNQGDVGDDYEEGAPDSKIRCPSDDCCRYYVSNMCTGTPKLDAGKFYNHCTMCPCFGRCIGDYREVHCPDCKKHYFSGLSSFACPNCERKNNGEAQFFDFFFRSIGFGGIL